MPGPVKDVKDAMINKDTLMIMMQQMDKDGDGSVSKEEFKVPWKKLFPKLSDKEFEIAWKTIDADGDGQLTLDELARHYGYDLSPNGKRSGDQEMSDEQILEALQMQAALDEMRLEQEKKKEDAEQAKTAAAAVGGPREKRGSRGLTGGSAGVGGSRAKMNSSAGISTIKMPAKVTETCEDPNILFLQMCELGDEKAILAATKSKEQTMRIEDDKGEMPLHKLARHGCLEAIRMIVERSGEFIKTDVNWQDKQGKTPIFYAAEYGHQKLVQLFLDRGADPLVENNNGWTVLHAAVNADKSSVVEDILSHPKVTSQKKALLEYPDKSKRVALHIAAFKSKEGDMVSLLLKHGADPSVTDAAGNTGAKLAGKTGRRKSKELLEEHMAGANAMAKK